MIGLQALLQMVEWHQERQKKHQQGGLSCANFEPPLSPPRRGWLTTKFNPQQIWPNLSVEERNRILGTLIRVVAQQVAKPLEGKEVTHER